MKANCKGGYSVADGESKPTFNVGKLASRCANEGGGRTQKKNLKAAN